MIPATLPPEFELLRANDQWILWEEQVRDGKKTKVPVDLFGFAINSQDPGQWMTYELAAERANATGRGAGFVVTAADNIFFLDVDHQLINGVWSDNARWARASFPGAAFEISTSGDGFHLIGKYTHRPEHSNSRLEPDS